MGEIARGPENVDGAGNFGGAGTEPSARPISEVKDPAGGKWPT